MYDPACLPTALMAQAAARELSVGAPRGKLAAIPLIREWLKPELVPALVALQQRTGTGATGHLLQLVQLALWGRLILDDPGACPSTEEDPLDWIG